jgi:glycosyltransferase involved in cell wall biosynthesis
LAAALVRHRGDKQLATEKSEPPVLFLARGGDIDGQQRQAIYLAEGLARRGLTVCASEPGELHDELVRGTVDSRIARMSSWRSVTRIVDRYIDAHRLLGHARQKKIRIVHAQDVWRAEYAHFIARRMAIPYVVHVRGPLTPRDIKKHKLNSADALVAIARRYVDDLLEFGIDPRRIALIDDGVDLNLFSPSQADPAYLSRNFGLKDRLLVGIVGRLSAFKRIRDFLDIVSRMPPDTEKALTFVVAGAWENAEYRGQIEEMVRRLGIASRVAFIGRIPDADAPKLLSSLDLLVTLSGGSVMFEAMAMNKPVLSIRTDGRHSEHTRHGQTAWCVDGNDADAAAAGLTCLLNDKALRHRLGQDARGWVEQHLSSSTMVDKVSAVYAELTA